MGGDNVVHLRFPKYGGNYAHNLGIYYGSLDNLEPGCWAATLDRDLSHDAHEDVYLLYAGCDFSRRQATTG